MVDFKVLQEVKKMALKDYEVNRDNVILDDDTGDDFHCCVLRTNFTV